MELQEMFYFVKRKWQTVVLFVLVFATLAFVFSVVQPQKYRSEQQFLVVSKYAEDVDPYAATRSTEYLSNLLSKVMYSQNFLNEVMGAGYALDEDVFPQDPKKQKKAWKKSLNTRVIGDTGIIEVAVYHTDRFVTEQLALAIGSVLQTEHALYHSRGDQVSITVIDQPITSLRPVQPNILLNTGAGVFLGILAGLAFIYLFPQREFQFNKDEQDNQFIYQPESPKPMVVAEPQLIAEPVKTTPSYLYEHSEVKRPTLGFGQSLDTDEPEQTSNRREALPPTNLPIG